MLTKQVLGTPLDAVGVFGDARRHVAEVYGADHALFSVHGSSGANWVVLRMLALEDPRSLVLVGRNSHHSVINALKAFGLDYRFVPVGYDVEFEALRPPSPADVRAALARHPSARAVVLGTPTYEGLAAHTDAIAEAVHEHSREAILVVDEAWGAHLPFHPALPVPALWSGADVCVQSTHKLAGSLQQSGVLLWRDGRVDSALLERANAEYATTSPSFHLIASADAAIRALAVDGHDALGRAIRFTTALKTMIRERLPAVGLLDDKVRAGGSAATVAGIDPIKATLSLSRFDVSGFEVADALRQRGVVVEKAGPNTVTLIATFRLSPEAVWDTLAALVDVLEPQALPGDTRTPALEDPFDTLDDAPLVPPYLAARHAKRDSVEVAFGDAAGRVAAEPVEVYPPGIPVVLEGFRVSEAALRYLRAVVEAGGSVVARDPGLRSLRVFPQRFAHSELSNRSPRLPGAKEDV